MVKAQEGQTKTKQDETNNKRQTTDTSNKLHDKIKGTR
jgi:hypothetical protein